MRQVRWLGVTLVVLGLSLSRPAVAEPRATLTVNPFGLLLGTVALELEYAPSAGFSVYLGPWAWMYEGPLLDHLTTDEELDYAAGAVGGARFFLAGEAPEGLWVGPEATLGVAQGDVSGVSNASLAWSLGGLGGFTWILGDILVVSAGAGVTYLDMRADVPGADVGQRGWAFTGRTAVGVAF